MSNLCIIPARALTDLSLTAEDIVVLCMLGMHKGRDVEPPSIDRVMLDPSLMCASLTRLMDAGVIQPDDATTWSYSVVLGTELPSQWKLNGCWDDRPLFAKRRRRQISLKVRYAVLKRDGFACVYCGTSAKDTELVLDHRTPVAVGGTDDPDNLCAACNDCNSGKGATV